MPLNPRQAALCLALPLSLATPALASEASADTPKDQDKVEVRGRAQTLYRATMRPSAPAPIPRWKLVPQSIQVVPRELIDDQAARQVHRSVPQHQRHQLLQLCGVTLRGFRQENVLYDGLRGDPYAGFSVPQLFNIERVEVLKGPAGALYGGGDAGGVINYVTQQAQGAPPNAASSCRKATRTSAPDRSKKAPAP